MFSPILNTRLHQLEENISRVLQLLGEYEEELLDEDDPGRRNKYRRRVENLKQQKSGYEEEFVELKDQLINEYPIQAQTLSTQLQQIDSKVELLLDGQFSLGKVLMLHFDSRERELLLSFTQQLSEADLINIEAFLEVVETDQVSEEEAQVILSETQILLRKIEEQNPALLMGKENISTIINSPTIDAKHALKVSIPIIPFILSYEGELGSGIGINLREVWKRLKSRFIGTR